MEARVTTGTAYERLRKSTNGRSLPGAPSVTRLAFAMASSLSPTLAAEIARQLFFCPPRAALRPEQHAVLALAATALLPVRDGDMRVYCWGEGPVVLMLHGWGGHAGQMTELVAPLTQAGYRVIAIDAPAHGRSPGRLSSIVHFADALAAAARVFGPVHAVVAHSMGAAATIRAIERGLTLKCAVFIAPPASFTGYWRHFRGGLGVSEAVWQIMRRRAERWLKIRYDQLHPESAAPRMKTPLLILHGTADRISPVAEAETLAGLWPGAEFRALDCGHLGILRDWRALLAAAAFVKRG